MSNVRTGECLSVAHVVLSLDLGGLERVVVDLVGAGRELGQRVSVLCVQGRGVLADRAEELGAEVMCLEKGPGLRPGLIGRMGALLRARRPDVVHTHQLGALVYAGPAARGAGIPVIHTEHGKHYPGRPRTRLLGRLAGLYGARFVAVSEDIAAEAVRRRIVPRRKVRVVPNGIDIARFGGAGDRDPIRRSLGLSAAAPLIGTVGRLSPIKRQDLLIRAFGRVRARVPEARLLLVGDGPELGRLQALAADLGVGDGVDFAGYQPSPERYLQAMDVFALTSQSEGMPLAVLEAWASGVPVVASRVGGLPELIEEGRTGLLFESGDEAALASALERLVADPEARRRIGAAGRERAESRYSLRRMAGDYQAHYLELLAASRRSRPCVSLSS